MDEREVADRLEIADVLARYTRAVDTGEWDRLSEVFTADAVIDYRAAGGIAGGLEEVREWLAEVLAHWPGRLHLIGAPVVDFTGDGTAREAVVLAPFTDTLAPSREMTDAGAKGFCRGGGWYRHRMIRTPEGWRSRELVEEQSWRTIG
ncbi:nuclear transport factor 2 family protein [Nonomuraea sp. NPDC049152]|uniref:nuclear transport factor 2 family protein n=1 Tax=Nonomuraea sp. NPDC049152 TaxID=3154350 RepID=UPI0033DDA5DA